MSFSKMGSVPNPIFDTNGDPFSGAVLKAFLPGGGTTSTSIAINSDGDSLQTSITANAKGIWEVSGNEIVPHIDRKVKWGIFANATDAAANTPFYMGPFDNILQTLQEGGSVVIPKFYATLTIAVTNIADISIGDVVIVEERSAGNGGGSTWNAVDATTVTENEIQIVTGNATVSLVLDLTTPVTLESLAVAEGGDASAALSAIILETGVTKVNTHIIKNINMSVNVDIERDDLTVILPNINWTGDFDLYPVIANDRSVGVISVKGVVGAQITTVSGAITEGDFIYTLTDATGISVGDYIKLSNRSEIAYTMLVEAISGNDVTTNYSSGWTIDTSLTGTVNVFATTVRKNVHIKTGVITDTVGSATSDNRPSGISFLFHDQCSLDVEDGKTFFNPIGFISDGLNMFVKRCKTTLPRATTSGLGYTIQLNNMLFAHTDNISGFRSRHLIDWTRCGYCTAKHINGVEGQNIQLSTHSSWEHDTTVRDYNSYASIGGFLTIGNTITFGNRGKRFRLKDATGSGSVHCGGAEQTVLENCNIEGNGSGNRRISQGTTLINCRMPFHPTSKIKVEGVINLQAPDDTTLTNFAQEDINIIGGVYDQMEFINFLGNIYISGGAVIEWAINGVNTETGTHDGAANAAVLTDTTANWEPSSLIGLVMQNTTDGSETTITANTKTTVTGVLAGGTDDDWDVSDAYQLITPPKSVKISDSALETSTAVTLSCSEQLIIEKTTLGIPEGDVASTGNSFWSSSPIYIVNSCVAKSSVGVGLLNATSSKFTLTDTYWIDIDSSRSAGIIRISGSTDCDFIMHGCNAQQAGEDVLQTERGSNSGTNQIITGNVILGTLTIKGASVDKSIIKDNMVTDATTLNALADATNLISDNLDY